MKKKVLFIILGSCIFLLISAITTLSIIRSHIKLYLVDGNRVNVQVFTEYKDNGAILKLGKKKINSKKYKVKVTGKYDTNKTGMYKVDYDVKYHGKELHEVKIVSVYDDIAPELTLNLEKVSKDYCTKKYKQEIKYTAKDNYDGDITDKVVVKEEEDKITYTVTDTNKNTTSKEVQIDYGTKPSNKFSLKGQSKVYVVVNNDYNEQGATYTDGCGNKINKEIKISGSVDTKTLGTYTITYEVDGEKAITRTVVVREKPHKIIYLTFDDGPGANTKKVLAALDKYNVKATFFVTNQFGGGKYQYLIKEEHDKGHAVGVHTLTHVYKNGDPRNIYASVDAYISDFNAMNEIIKEQTGSYTKIFRFPGGSGNTVSKSSSIGVVTAIAEEMTKRGYVYFDWNLSSGDASSGKVTSEKIINNVLNHVDNCAYNCVILFHDYKSQTANAIEPIVKELVNRGYEFKTLSEDGPTVHAKIKN
ncbi:MAG: polysaccharide deacetylase family protein [Bacilli bacterium]|nr:polysaccharide deacetylase family protein [Bacilli bacterium]